ncbi:MAG: hypothetical protein CSB55_04640 [Candidatus Cloacimonadota bacterium]|nr:MAG: hypothetical protein CSB55_04640 [Candidatus Cloacimonadota bacterium]
MNKKAVIVIALSIMFFSLSAQQLPIKNYSVADGLLEDSVFQISQDDKGYIWIQTDNGISKFDGENFTNYTEKDGLIKNISVYSFFSKGSFYSFSDTEMSVIKNDSINLFGKDYFSSYFNDSIVSLQFMSVDDEIAVYGLSQNKIYVYDDAENKFDLKHDLKPQVILTEDKNASFLYPNGMLILDGNNMKFVRLDTGKIFDVDLPDWDFNKKNDYSFFKYVPSVKPTKYPDEKLENIFCYEYKPDGSASLLYFDDLSKKPDVVFKDKFYVSVYSLDKYRNYGIYSDGENAYYTDSFGHIFKINILNGRKEKFDRIEGLLPYVRIRFVLEHEGWFWLATNCGVYKYNLETKELKHITIDEGLSSNLISGFFIDRENDVWIITDNNGADFLIPSKFETYSAKDGMPYSETTASTQTSDGIIWTSTYGGLYKIEPGEKPVYYKLDNNLPEKDTWGIFADSNDIIWLSTVDGRIFNFDGNKFTDVTPENFIKQISITVFFESRSGEIWVPYFDGMLIYKDRKFRYEKFSGGAWIYKFKYDPKGKKIWASGGSEGLFVFDEKGRFLDQFEIDKDLFDSQIVDFMFMDDETIWCVTYGSGIAVFDSKRDKFTEMIQEPFENSLIMKSAVRDSLGNIWFGTVNSIYRYDGKDFIKYTENEGLPGGSFRTIGAYRDMSGNLWFNSSFGIVKVDPYSCLEDTIPPKLSFSYVEINKNKYLDVSKIPELSYKDRNFVFSYNGIDFRNSKNIEYSYFLEGFDEKPSEFSKDKKVAYTNILPGNYTFHVRAKDAAGNVSKEISCKIIINKPWFIQLKAVVLYVIFLFSAVYLYTRLRIYNYQKNSDKLNAVVEERTKELKLKNKQIHDSMNYARRIQQSILPDEEEMKEYFTDMFLIYKPMYMISGDFYWYYRNEEYDFILSADCTGHGISGAMLVMVGKILLIKLVENKHIIEPAEILNMLHEDFKAVLRQDTDFESIRDSIEISLCRINRNTDVLTFSGSRRPVYRFTEENGKGELIKIKGERLFIGGKRKNESRFTQKDIQLKKGDMLYLSTDGFIDQSNPENKKFGSRKFEKLLEEYAPKPLSVQKRYLCHDLEEHMQDEKQRDDITVLGIRV